jgi:hypothetical protein
MIKLNFKPQEKLNPLIPVLMFFGFIISLLIHWILAIGVLGYVFWYFTKFSVSWLAIASLLGFFGGVVTLLAGFDQLANGLFALVFVVLLVFSLIRILNNAEAIDVKEQKYRESKKKNLTYILVNVLMVTGYVLVFNIIPETSLLWHMTLLGVLIVFANFIVWQYEITK